MSKTDAELLADFNRGRSDTAFAELVSRYVDLIYSVALRMVGGDRQLAEDVTQSVFIHLARYFPRLKNNDRLAGWLHRHATFTAAKMVRAERRRKKREKIAMELNSSESSLKALWDSIAPELDQCMNQLRGSDRELLVLRYMKRYDLRSLGHHLGISEDAAQKRVSRALEKLRRALKHRGLTETALATLLAESFVNAAPAGLGTVIATKSMSTAAASGTSLPFVKLLAVDKLNVAMGTLALVSVLVPVVVHERIHKDLSEQNVAIGENSALLADVSRLTDQAARPTSALEVSRALSDGEFRELMTLRSKVGNLRRSERRLVRELSQVSRPASRQEMLSSLKTRYAVRVEELKSLFDDNPAHAIPELGFLDENDWLFLVSQRFSDDDDGYLKLMSRARTMAESEFGNRFLKPALEAFAAENQGRFPPDLTSLETYFNEPIEEAIMERWVITSTARFVENLRSQVPNDRFVITQKAAIDPFLDQRYILGLNDGLLFSDGPPEFWDWRK